MTARKDSPSLTAPLSTIDLTCLLMDRAVRPLDFTLILRFSRSLENAGLVQGATSARNAFPITNSVIKGKSWHLVDARSAPVPECHSRTFAPGVETVLGEFVGKPFRPSEEPPLRQVLLRDADEADFRIATKVHHCAADLLSCLQWVRHQLRVASGTEPPIQEAAPFEPIPLASSPPGARRNPDWMRSERLWTRGDRPSGERRWSAFSIPVNGLEDLSRKRNGFTYNDVLVAAALETAHWWNARNGKRSNRVGLWLPINIRRDSFVGFGNGSSRIRVRHIVQPTATFREQCLSVRSQVDRARRNGEWIVPQRPLALRLPLVAVAPALRAYLRRPWADTGSLSFTHVQRWPGRDEDCFQDLVGIEIVGALHTTHPLMLAAVTCHDRTWLTATFDPALLRDDDIAAIGHYFREAVSTAAGAV